MLFCVPNIKHFLPTTRIFINYLAWKSTSIYLLVAEIIRRKCAKLTSDLLAYMHVSESIASTIIAKMS